MKMEFSKRSQAFPEGIFSVLNKKKEELLKEGRTVYNFSVGTPDFRPPAHIMEAFLEAGADRLGTSSAVSIFQSAGLIEG